MTLKSKPLAALVIAIMFGGIIFSSALGWWQTESTKEAATYTTGEFAGQANPDDIRGSYTFGDVEKNFAIPATLLAEAFGVQSGEPAAYQLKGLEEMYAASSQEIGTASVRLFVAFYLGLPYDLSTDIYLPETAAALLHERGLTGEQAAYLEAHTIANQAIDSGAEESIPLPSQAGSSQTIPTQPDPHPERTPVGSGERQVKGKTTFGELLEWGVPKEAIEKVLGKPMPAAPGMTVKDFCAENGLSFEVVKAALQAECDRMQP